MGALSRSLAACLAIAALATAAPARAQGDPSTIADALFADAKHLLEAGKVDQACPKFAESLRLAPTLGTRLNLAHCYEVQGKTASAWGQYKEVVRTGGDDTKRVDIAKERVSTLEQILSRVTIQGSADVGLQMKLDGQVLDAAVLGTAFAIDPGDHALEVSAPNKQARSVTFHVEVAKSASVDLPTLTPTTATPVGPDASPTQTPEQPTTNVSSGKRMGGFVTIGVGGALLVAGAIFGGVTISLASDVRAACPDVVCTNQDALSKDSTAHTLAVLSDVLVPLGLVAIGVGAYLVVTAPRRAPSLALAPTFGPGSGGLSLTGRF